MPWLRCGIAVNRVRPHADFLIREMGDLPARLEADGYEVKVLAEPGEPEPYLALLRGNGVLSDVMAAQTDFQGSALDRGVDDLITVEDVIVFKLLAWRARDRADVDSILSVGHELDEGYIEHWVQEWQVSDRWAQAKLRRGSPLRYGFPLARYFAR